MFEERNIPSFMRNSIDFKKSIATSIFSLIQDMREGKFEGVSLGPNTTAAVITNFGLVRGKVVLFDNESEKGIYENHDYDSLIYMQAIKTLDESMANFETEVGSESVKLVNYTGRLVLADAVVTPYANPQSSFNFSRLLLFTDQIVGITFGEESRR